MRTSLTDDPSLSPDFSESGSRDQKREEAEFLSPSHLRISISYLRTCLCPRRRKEPHFRGDLIPGHRIIEKNTTATIAAMAHVEAPAKQVGQQQLLLSLRPSKRTEARTVTACGMVLLPAKAKRATVPFPFPTALCRKSVSSVRQQSGSEQGLHGKLTPFHLCDEGTCVTYNTFVRLPRF